MASEHAPAIDQLMRDFGEHFDRQVRALESISASFDKLAASLEKLANPPVVVKPPRVPIEGV